MRAYSAAVLLLLASTAARAQSPTAAPAPAAAPLSQEARAKAAIKAAEAEIAEWQRCRRLERSFKADYEQKKAQLQAEYGRVPETHAEVLVLKNKRVTRLHELCQAKSKSASDMLQAAGSVLDGSEPKSQGWIQPRVKELTALMRRFSQLASAAPPPAQDE